MQNNSDIIISNQLLSGYSNDTEVMTDAGWKLIKDINAGNDLVMSLNHENGCIEMVNVFDSVSNQVNNALYHFFIIEIWIFALQKIKKCIDILVKNVFLKHYRLLKLIVLGNRIYYHW